MVWELVFSQLSSIAISKFGVRYYINGTFGRVPQRLHFLWIFCFVHLGDLFEWEMVLLLMEEILLHQLRLVVYPVIYKVFLHPNWLFGISEPSTVSQPLGLLKVQVQVYRLDMTLPTWASAVAPYFLHFACQRIPRVQEKT